MRLGFLCSFYLAVTFGNFFLSDLHTFGSLIQATQTEVLSRAKNFDEFDESQVHSEEVSYRGLECPDA